MGWLSLLTLAVALAVDAFAVAVVTGVTLKVVTKRHLFRLGFHFGLFQALMVAGGWALGHAVQRYLGRADHWIAFALLTFVGGRVVWEALHGEEEARAATDLTTGWDLVMVSVATSIDALAVGLSLGVMGTKIAMAAFVIGITASVLTLLGMALGRKIGAQWGRRVEVLGGLVLIVIGLKIVWEHLR
jgi:manganese efflux pump family protein